MDGVEAIFFGYIGNYVRETPRHEVWGYRFDAELDAGEIDEACINCKKFVDYSNFKVPIVFLADQYNDTVESAKADRTKFFKALNISKGYDAAVKVTGTFRVFNNTGNLYMRGADIEVIQANP